MCCASRCPGHIELAQCWQELQMGCPALASAHLVHNQMPRLCEVPQTPEKSKFFKCFVAETFVSLAALEPGVLQT